MSFDVNYRPTLWRTPEEALHHVRQVLPLAHMVKVNEGELEMIAGKGETSSCCRAVLEAGPRLCVVTLGQEAVVRWRLENPSGRAARVAFADELGPAYYDMIQDDLRGRINGVMTSGKVKSVVFNQFSVMKL